MRVISGSAGGITLKTVPGDQTRPTTDRNKENLFNIIYSRYPNMFATQTKVLDLFAGSGALGIECLSRGSGYCCFNDQSSKVTRQIKENLSKTNMNAPLFDVYNLHYEQCIRLLSAKEEGFHLVFLDPPYMSVTYDTVIRSLIEQHIVVQNSLICIERSTKLPMIHEHPDLKGLVHCTFSRIYGSVAFELLTIN